MRYKRRQLIEAVSLLKQSSLLIKTIGDEEEIKRVLEDCQALAIRIGNDLEARPQDMAIAVGYLEAYCEYLYEISVDGRNKMLQSEAKIQDLLEKVESLICGSIPEDKREIVFLPYKASMWDSMESVWKAAKKDDHFEVYVVPVPYFEKRNGVMGEMACEIEMFPDYVPVTMWTEYDISLRKPDVIIIHNPYDQYNHVTSVHPRYYACNLKQYTDMLVYIPYFVVGSINGNKETSVDRVRHFCFLPGVVYADKVIVESDEIKQIYVEEYKKQVLTAGWKGDADDLDESLQKKILALGSPKYDRLIGQTEEMCSLPPEWNKMLLRADGRRKHVMFYNTGISALLQYDDRWVAKIESVFTFMKKHQDSWTVIWRPHPLIEETLRSLRPDLAGEFARIREGYVSAHLGIYDDTPNLDESIMLSDAYFGDESSVVSLFQRVGKPVCIQNCVVNQYICEEVRICAYAEKDDCMYAVAMDYNALLRINSRTRIVEEIYEFPYTRWNIVQLISGMGIWKNKLWFFPFEGRYIFSFDILKREWATYPLPSPWPEDYTGRVVSAGIQVDNVFYGFCYNRYGVMEINMETEKLSYLREGLEDYKLHVRYNDRCVCRNDCCRVGRSIYAAGMAGNIVMEYNIDSKCILTHAVGKAAYTYATICFDGEYFWLTGDADVIHKWNPMTDDLQEIPLCVNGFEKTGTYAFGSSQYMDGYVWLFADSSNMNICVDTKTGYIDVIKVYESDEAGGYPYVTKSWIRNQKVIYAEKTSALLTEVNRDKIARQYAIIRPVDEKYLKEIWKRLEDRCDHGSIEAEHVQGMQNLKSYLKYVELLNAECSEKISNGERVHKTVGDKICEILLEG